MSYRDSIVHKIDCPRSIEHFAKFQRLRFVVYFVLIARRKGGERERERKRGSGERKPDVIISISPGNRRVEVKELSIEPDGMNFVF